MKKIFSTIIILMLVCGIAICAVACNKPIEKDVTKEEAVELLFGTNKALALLDKSVNLSVEYAMSKGTDKMAGEAKYVLDETNKDKFINVYFNSTVQEGEKTENVTEYVFNQWKEGNNGKPQRTFVMVAKDSATVDPTWFSLTGYEIEDYEEEVSTMHGDAMDNSGMNYVPYYIRQSIYNQGKDVFDTLQFSGKTYYSDRKMTDMVKAEIVITYSYADEKGKTVTGKATIVLEKKDVKVTDGTTASNIAITSINIVEEGGYTISATYTYGVSDIGAPTEENYKTAWPKAYPIA